MSDLNMSHGKMPDFVPFPFRFALVIKLTNFGFESHWNTLILFDKKVMMSDWDMLHERMSDLVSFPLFGFTLVIKLQEISILKVIEILWYVW